MNYVRSSKLSTEGKKGSSNISAKLRLSNWRKNHELLRVSRKAARPQDCKPPKIKMRSNCPKLAWNVEKQLSTNLSKSRAHSQFCVTPSQEPAVLAEFMSWQRAIGVVASSCCIIVLFCLLGWWFTYVAPPAFHVWHRNEAGSVA